MSRSTKRTITTISLAIVLGLAIVFTGCLTGCFAGLQLTPTQEMGIHKVARIAGITIALKKPDNAAKMLSYIQYINDPETVFTGPMNIDTILAAANDHLLDKYGRTQENLIIAAELGDTIKFIVDMFPKMPTIDGEIPDLNMPLLNVALDGFEEGINLANPKVDSKTRALRLL